MLYIFYECHWINAGTGDSIPFHPSSCLNDSVQFGRSNAECHPIAYLSSPKGRADRQVLSVFAGLLDSKKWQTFKVNKKIKFYQMTVQLLAKLLEPFVQ